MKRSLLRILALVLSISLVAAFSLYGCKEEAPAGEEVTEEVEEVEETEEEVVVEEEVALAPATIQFMNSKSEIQAQLEEAAVTFSEENPGITVEIITAPEGSSPFERITALYAAGNAPALAMLDAGQIELMQENILDLSGEKWIADAAEGNLAFGTMSDGSIVAFPFTVEGYAFIYNGAVLDEASVDPTSIKTLDDLTSAFEAIDAIGIAPISISPMDWSLGAHFLTISYH